MSFPCLWRRSFLAVGILVSAILKILSLARHEPDRPEAMYWFESWQFALPVILAEIVLPWFLLSKRWRIASLVCLIGVFVAGAFIVGLRVSGIDVKRCGCFGSVTVSFAAHLGIVTGFGLLALSCLVAPRGDRVIP